MAEVSKNTSYKGSRQTCTWEGHLSQEKKAAAHSPYSAWWTWCKPSKEVRLSHGRGFLTPVWNLLPTARALVKETLLSYLAALTVLSQTGLLVLVDMGCKEPEAFLPARVTSPAANPGPWGLKGGEPRAKPFSHSSLPLAAPHCLHPALPAPCTHLSSILFYGEGEEGSALTAAQLMRTFVDRTPLPHPLNAVSPVTAMNRPPPYTGGENNLSHSFNTGFAPNLIIHIDFITNGSHSLLNQMLDVLKINPIPVLPSPQHVTAAVVLMAANHFTGTEAELLHGCFNSAQNFLRRVKTSFLGKQEDKTCVPGLCVTGCHWPELGTMKCVSEEIPQRDHRAAGNWITAQNGHWAANLSAAAALHSPLERFPGFCISSIPRACPYCPLCIPGSDPGLCNPKWVGTISRRWLHVNNW